MGDIAFLLIIFFLLTTNFAKEKHIQLKDPVSRDIQVMKEPMVFVAVDQNGAVHLQGRPCSVDTLEDQVRSMVARHQDKVVKLRVDRGVRQDQYGPVFLALSRAGVQIALTGELPKGKE
jgi:biopolymer transport protein ExbD